QSDGPTPQPTALRTVRRPHIAPCFLLRLVFFAQRVRAISKHSFPLADRPMRRNISTSWSHIHQPSPPSNVRILNRLVGQHS
ncbi:hypothetical protein BD779DRAFT_1583313, partial [Infundibulicybe gibba]